MASILEASSVLEALQHLYRPPARKKQVPLALFSRKLGYKSSRFLEMILKGDRPPSPDFLARTGSLFSLSESEQRFLELLARKRHLEEAGRPTLDVERRITSLKKKVVSARFIEPHFFTLFSDWYCLVIKQLLPAYPDGLTVSEIAGKFRGKVTESEAQKAVHALLHLGYVKRGARSGSFTSDRQETLYTKPDLPSQAVRKHHRQMMERAIEALEEQAVQEREMISLTFRCPASAILRLKEAMRKFRDEINAEFSENSASVLQLNLQLFPHTK